MTRNRNRLGWEETHHNKTRKKKKKPKTQQQELKIRRQKRNNNAKKTKKKQQKLTCMWSNDRAKDNQVRQDHHQELRDAGGHNDSYGTPKGHSKLTKSSHEVRILSQNVNGIPYDKRHTKSKECMNYLLAQDVCKVFRVSAGSVVLGLDGQSARNQVDSTNMLQNTTPSADLIHAIRVKCAAIQKMYGISIDMIWIEGHQLERYGRESYEGFLNRRADELAKQFRHSLTGPSPPTVAFEGEGWSIWIDEVKQENFDFELFYNLTFGATVTKRYWMNRQGLSEDQYEAIDWDPLEAATRNWYFGKTRWLSKAMAGITPTGRQMLRRKEWDHSR